MNVLTYVMTMLLLLSALTYARMESYRSTAGLEVGFISYMETQGRKPISLIADEWYDSIHFSVNAHQQRKRNQVKANSRISFYLLLDQTARSQSGDALQQTRELIKRLMTLLYKDEAFFKEIHDERPNFINEMLDEIIQAANNLPEEIRITRPTRLSKLQFQDKRLQYVFYLMLHGLPKLEPKPTDPSENSAGEEIALDTQTDNVIAEEGQEDHAAGGYVSLLDYLTVRSYIKTRVFLASKPLLMAIFDNEATVETVINLRQELYGRVKSATPQTSQQAFSQASLEFQNTVQMLGSAPSFAAILDYSVSNVNPRSYE